MILEKEIRNLQEKNKLETMKGWKFKNVGYFNVTPEWKRKIGKNEIRIQYSLGYIDVNINRETVLREKIQSPRKELKKILQNPQKLLVLAKLRGVV